MGGRGDSSRSMGSEEASEAPMQMVANAGPVAVASTGAAASATEDVSFDDDDIPF